MITLEAFEQQLEIQKMYRDDKFAAKLKECRDLIKEAQDAQKALNEREKDLTAREKLCEVITNSQKEFNRWKEEAEAEILEDRQENQRAKDEIVEKRAEADTMMEDARKFRDRINDSGKRAEADRQAAETMKKNAAVTLAEAEAAKVQWETKLRELGLKVA